MSTQHQTRRQRKAAASGTPKKEEITIEEIPMVTPDYDARPTEKTLFDLAAERQAELQAKADVLNAKKAKDKSNATSNSSDKDPPGVRLAGVEMPGAKGRPIEETPVLSAIVYAFSLSMVHYTLDFLVQYQYAQDVSYSIGLRRVTTVFPTVALMSYTTSVAPIATFPLFRQLLFLAMAVGTGCYGLRLGNGGPFMAVMKFFPPVGVACLWAVCEMEVVFTGVFLFVMIAYAWWEGFLFY